jgi:ADP-L-glycero-D-manno-heptose 6-epimerase
MTDSPLIITGAAGFIGARLVQACNAQGIDLISVDDPSMMGAREEHAGLDFGRVLHRDELLGTLESERPQLRGIVHLGACTDTTELDVEYLTRVNLDYSRSLWQFCTVMQVPLVYASSAATYGDGAQGYDDDEGAMASLKPLNPYGQSKLDFDLWALEQESLNVAPPHWSGFKFFNVYGFGERHKQRMASVVLQAFDQNRESGRVRLFQSHHPDYEDGGQMRDFAYVKDCEHVVRWLMENRDVSGLFNLGTGRAQTWLELMNALYAAVDQELQVDWVDTPEEIRDRYQYFTEADMGRLRAAGYDRSFRSVEEGVADYVERHLSRDDPYR